MFENNVGLWDRILRIVIGVALIAAFFFMPQWVSDPTAWRWALWIGVLPLASGLAGFCPVYRWLGYDSHDRGGGAAARA